MSEQATQADSSTAGGSQSTSAPSPVEQRVASLSAQQTTAPDTKGDQTSSPAATPSSPPASQRPDYLDEVYWDAEKNLPKLDALAADAKKAREFEAKQAERLKHVPESADKYEFGMPEGFKPPEGFDFDPKHPIVPKFRDWAKAHDLTNDEFKEALALATEMKVLDRVRDDELVSKAVKARDESLGPNGTERVDKLNAFFKAQYGEQAGKHLAATLFNKDIIEAWEKTSEALTRQNIIPFNNRGREERGREDGRPEGWDKMSAVDRRTWELQQQQSRRA